MSRKKRVVVGTSGFAALVAVFFTVRWLNQRARTGTDEERERLIKEAGRVLENRRYEIEREGNRVARWLGRVSDGARKSYERVFARRFAKKLDDDESEREAQ